MKFTATIEVPVLQDTILEANETVVVTLSGVSGDGDITLDGSNDEATVTIDSDDLATITVADLLDVEADLASNAPVVTYTLNAVGATTAMDTAFTADINVTDGTARAAGIGVGSDDYDAIDTALSVIAVGDTGTLTITVNDDNVVERDETINIDLSNLLIGGAVFDSLNPYFSELVVSESATVTIENNDAATISMAPVIVLSLEPDSGTDNQIYKVHQLRLKVVLP